MVTRDSIRLDSSEIDPATSRPAVDEAGSVFDCTRMQFETLYFLNCKKRCEDKLRIRLNISG